MPSASKLGTQPEDLRTDDPLVRQLIREIDRGLLRENLKLSVSERADRMMRFIRTLDQVRGVAAHHLPAVEVTKHDR